MEAAELESLTPHRTEATWCVSYRPQACQRAMLDIVVHSKSLRPHKGEERGGTPRVVSRDKICCRHCEQKAAPSSNYKDLSEQNILLVEHLSAVVSVDTGNGLFYTIAYMA